MKQRAPEGAPDACDAISVSRDSTAGCAAVVRGEIVDVVLRQRRRESRHDRILARARLVVAQRLREVVGDAGRRASGNPATGCCRPRRGRRRTLPSALALPASISAACAPPAARRAQRRNGEAASRRVHHFTFVVRPDCAVVRGDVGHVLVGERRGDRAHRRMAALAVLVLLQRLDDVRLVLAGDASAPCRPRGTRCASLRCRGSPGTSGPSARRRRDRRPARPARGGGRRQRAARAAPRSKYAIRHGIPALGGVSWHRTSRASARKNRAILGVAARGVKSAPSPLITSRGT